MFHKTLLEELGVWRTDFLRLTEVSASLCFFFNRWLCHGGVNYARTMYYAHFSSRDYRDNTRSFARQQASTTKTTHYPISLTSSPDI